MSKPAELIPILFPLGSVPRGGTLTLETSLETSAVRVPLHVEIAKLRGVRFPKLVVDVLQVEDVLIGRDSLFASAGQREPIPAAAFHLAALGEVACFDMRRDTLLQIRLRNLSGEEVEVAVAFDVEDASRREKC